jgi:predicted nucleotidyltransferase
MKTELTKAIKIIDDLNDYLALWHFSLGGSILTQTSKPNDIDIVVNHATHDRSGAIEAIKETLEEMGYTLSENLLGACNINFYANKPEELPLHIIIYH